MNGKEFYEQNHHKLVDRWLKNNPDKPYLPGFYYFINNLSATTVYSYVTYVSNFMDFAKKTPEELQLDDYTGYLASLRSATTSSFQIATYSALKKFSLYLQASGRNEKFHMQYIERPKFRETASTLEKREKGYLEKHEVKKYMQAVEEGVGNYRAKGKQKPWKERDKAIITILLNTGMRRSALYKLDIDSVDLENKVVITSEKGGKVRAHDLSEETVHILKDWIKKREQILGDNQENALFISNRKSRIDQASIGNIVKKYNVIEGKNITPHKLRATYGTQLYKKTGDLYFVQSCMNHNSPKTTELYIRGQKNDNGKRASAIMSDFMKW